MQAPLLCHGIPILILWFCCVPSFAAAAKQPNVILITLDTVRADRMAFSAQKYGVTPQLDALASQSVVFEHAYSQAPITRPLMGHTHRHVSAYHGIRTSVIVCSNRPLSTEILHIRATTPGPSLAASSLTRKTGFASGFERGFDVYDAGFHRRIPESAARPPCSAAAR